MDRLVFLALAVLVLSLLASQHAQLSFSYLPQLEDWQYIRELQVSHCDDTPFLLHTELPSDENFWSHTDLNDLRITSWDGSHEHLLQFYLDGNDLYISLDACPTTIRLYYGNSGAPRVWQPLSVSTWCRDFDESHYTVYHEGEDWSYPKFRSNKIELVRWDEDAKGYLRYYRPFPSVPIRESFELKFNKWSSVSLFIPTDDANYSPEFFPFEDVIGETNPDYNFPGHTGLLVFANDTGKIFIDVLVDGHVVSRDVRSSSTVRVSILRQGDRYAVYVGSTKIYSGYATQPEFPIVYYASGEDESGKVEIKKWCVSLHTVSVDPEWTSEALAPKAPHVSVLSPPDLVLEGNTEIHVLATDPNNDIVSLEVSLDSNTIYSGSSTEFTADLNLPEGYHTLVATATDSEGASDTATHTFLVDYFPPDLNASVSTDENGFVIDVNAWDSASPVTCTVAIDSNVYDIDCNTVSHFPADLNVSHTIVVTATDAADRSTSLTFTYTPPSPGEEEEGGVIIREVYVYKELPCPTCESTQTPLRPSVTHAPPVQPAAPVPAPSNQVPLILVALVIAAFLLRGFILT